MNKKISFMMVLSLLALSLFSACDQNTSKNPDKSTADNTIEAINKSNRVDQIYYQKLTFDRTKTSLNQAVEQIKTQVGTTERNSYLYDQNITGREDALIALYAEEDIYKISMYATTKPLLEKNDYLLPKLIENDIEALALHFEKHELNGKNEILILPYVAAEENNLFLIWENAEGAKSYFALGNLNHASEHLASIENTENGNAVLEALNKENSIGTTYYQSISIMYDHENIDDHVAILEEEAGVKNRTAVINKTVADGNSLFLIYGEKSISDLALYTIDLNLFEKIDYDTDLYAEKYLPSSDKIAIASSLTPREYAVIRCDETEGLPTHLIAWKDSDNKTKFFVATYNGKGQK